MEFDPVPLAGAYVVRLRKIADDRGYFARAWCADEFRQQGLRTVMPQANVGFSPRRGTLRGMHFQRAPHAEAKLVRCTHGAVFDVIVDLRADSVTRGRWFGIELAADDGLQLYVPEGFAHGYLTLRDDSEVQYMTSAGYAPGSASGVRYDDPTFSIAWPAPIEVISAADRSWPLIAERDDL
ncbi:MAG: dTDP-4-dehydrorhamnose 3,5-epimerase [Burkholderiales bacterium]|nr:dTDP-4-dehydrorhamnose 3,5-epimerase [Burkholderiales bacterium]